MDDNYPQQSEHNSCARKVFIHSIRFATAVADAGFPRWKEGANRIVRGDNLLFWPIFPEKQTELNREQDRLWRIHDFPEEGGNPPGGGNIQF